MAQRLTGKIAVLHTAGAALDWQWLDGSRPRFDEIFVLRSSTMSNAQRAFGVTQRNSSVANIVNTESRCFGGSQTGFTVTGAFMYGSVTNGASGDVGNTDNPGTPVQPYINASYKPAWTSISKANAVAVVNPFNESVNVRITL